MSRRLAGALIALAICGCPDPPIDPDANCEEAGPLPTGMLVKDSLDTDAGDHSDCKQLGYLKDGTLCKSRPAAAGIGTRFTWSSRRRMPAGAAGAAGLERRVPTESVLPPGAARHRAPKRSTLPGGPMRLAVR